MITGEGENSKIAAIIAGGYGRTRRNDNLSIKQCLDFLFSLRLKKGTDKAVFVSYGFSFDIEIMFRKLSNDQKDRLFQSCNAQSRRAQLEQERISNRRRLKTLKQETPEYQDAVANGTFIDFLLSDLETASHAGYEIEYISGKILKIKKDAAQFILYDIYGFFRAPLASAVCNWLGRRTPVNRAITRNEASMQAALISELAAKLDNELQRYGINISQYYGSGAIANKFFQRSNARKQYKNFRYREHYKKQELYDIARCAYFGGRVEQLKLGCIGQPIYVYDINSAYPAAITHLPVLLKEPECTSDYVADAPFSVWYVTYDFSALNPYLGYLPFRGLSEAIQYGLKGCGYYWQPEVNYLVNRYPDCVRVEYGYILRDYQVAPFTSVMRDLYDLRIRAKRDGSPLASVMKHTATTIYGKFCSREKVGAYYNLMYAGFVTSFIRARLLAAVNSAEDSVICFSTDAVHSLKPLPLSLSDKLGEWTRKEYASGFYLESGVYALNTFDGHRKIARSGFKDFNIDKAISEFEEKGLYTVEVENFINYNLFATRPAHISADYLSIDKQTQYREPLNSKARAFQKNVNGFYDSKIVTGNILRPSAPRRTRDGVSVVEIGRDSLLSGRV